MLSQSSKSVRIRRKGSVKRSLTGAVHFSRKKINCWVLLTTKGKKRTAYRESLQFTKRNPKRRKTKAVLRATISLYALFKFGFLVRG